MCLLLFVSHYSLLVVEGSLDVAVTERMMHVKGFTSKSASLRACLACCSSREVLATSCLCCKSFQGRGADLRLCAEESLVLRA